MMGDGPGDGCCWQIRGRGSERDRSSPGSGECVPTSQKHNLVSHALKQCVDMNWRAPTLPGYVTWIIYMV